MSRRVLAGLLLGLIAGTVAKALALPALLWLADALEPLGTLWVHAILATVVPLVVASLIVGVAGAGDARFVGQLGRRVALLFALFAAASALAGALLAPPLIAWMRLDDATVSALRASVTANGAAPSAAPTVRQWIVELVPANAIHAAADGAMLPLVLFTLAFAVALTRIESGLRIGVVRFFDGVDAAMRVLIAWVLSLAPVGVFALSFALAARLGLSAAGALAYYVALAVIVSVVLLVLLYAVTAGAAGVSLRRFARAAARPQAVAFGSRSSLASLPALLESAERDLGVPPATARFALPLAVATFKLSSPAAMLAGLLFAARLYGVAIGPLAIAQGAAMAVVLSFAVPGIPGGWLLIGAPIFAAAGVPLQAIGMLLAVDAIPDMFRTTLNVTGDLAATAIVGRSTRVNTDGHSPGTA